MSSDLKKSEQLHTGESTYSHIVCENAVINISHLKVHEELHTGEDSYSLEGNEELIVDGEVFM
ncbi:hypothetical protein Cfor_01460 [Coptotermes formosanus]|uniref:C2H2-type domain-containing protein n=1 Tax=Coptotermes formosanus TaxID=36987 RepID=A0A6L2QF38_COPFO|nr:hypothetical protein Cfor_01460 [Coptotermes formosanus]